MSFCPGDYQGGEDRVKCPCGQEYHPDYELQNCGHPGCTQVICVSCAILCGSCGKNIRCDEHAWRTTYSGALSNPIQVCEQCRNEELDELAEAVAVGK